MLSVPLRRLWATIVLAAMCGSTVVPVFGDLHADGDILIAAEQAAASHHHTDQFEGICPSLVDDHCAVCHLQRAMGGAADDAKRYVASAVTAPWTVGTARRSIRTGSRTNLPPRAPPVSLF